MSEGARIELARAQGVAAELMTRWGLDPSTSMVVGSIRRRRDWVTDIDIVAPVEPASADKLCEAIVANVRAPQPSGMLFGGEPTGQLMGVVDKGLKAGFLSVSMMLEPWPGVKLKTQIFRYTPENRGWVELCRTGPREFGMWYLGRWKKRMNIPVGDPRYLGSSKGHLIDAAGDVVPVPTEQAAFEIAGLKFVPPENRDAFMDHINTNRSNRS